MTRRPRPYMVVDPTPAIPNIVHDRAEPRRFYDGVWHAEPAFVHPCGVLKERGVTHEPHVDNWDYANQRIMPPWRVTCPTCVRLSDEHVAACAAVRFGGAP